MKELIAYSVLVTLLLFTSVGYIIYHKAVEDQQTLQENSDLFTDRIRAENKITDLNFQIDTLNKHYATNDSASKKTDTLYIKIKQRIAAIPADSNCRLLSAIYTEIDSVFKRYYDPSLKP